jgi:hypothetical protein
MHNSGISRTIYSGTLKMAVLFIAREVVFLNSLTRFQENMVNYMLELYPKADVFLTKSAHEMDYARTP